MWSVTWGKGTRGCMAVNGQMVGSQTNSAQQPLLIPPFFRPRVRLGRSGQNKDLASSGFWPGFSKRTLRCWHQGPMTWMLALTGCAFSNFMRPSSIFHPFPAPIMVRMGGSGACEAAHHCCCCSSFLELLEGSLRNGLFRPQGKLRNVSIRSYANTFQNIMQEKILPFLLVRLQGLWKLHLSFVISSL